MKVKKASDLKSNPAPYEYFTGKAWIDSLVKNEGIDCNTLHVTFEPTSRNHWHYHTKGQILIVTAGTGFVQKQGEDKQILEQGDVVVIEPDEVHWHGAAPDRVFSHIAIQLLDEEGNETVWLGPVTDEEYNM